MARTLRLLGLACLLTLAASAPAGAGAPPDPFPGQPSGTALLWSELRLPVGPPRGAVLLLNAGGWVQHGPNLVRELSAYRGLVDSWRQRGIATLTATYRPGGIPSYQDVVAQVDQLRVTLPGVPVCIYGQSSGGHLALLAAASRKTACVMGDGAITDLQTLPVQSSFGPYFDERIDAFFGPADGPHPNRLDYSPIGALTAAEIPDAFLIAGGEADGRLTDPIVPHEQDDELVALLGSRATLRLLRPGPRLWVHGNTDPGDDDAAYAALLDWSVAELEKARPAAAAAPRTPGLPAAPSPPGSYVVRSCGAAPPGTGVASEGGWQEQPALPYLDVVEVACTATGDDADSPPATTETGNGLELGVRPQAGVVVPSGTGASATFAAPPGTTITSLVSRYHGSRNAPGWDLGLDATGPGGAVTPVLGCPPGACSSVGADELAVAGSSVPDLAFFEGPLTLPAGTTAVTWHLRCVAPAGCDASPDDRPQRLRMPAFLDVFGSRLTLAHPAAPTLGVLPAALARPAAAAPTLAATIAATDPTGVARVEARVDGAVRAEADQPCNFTQPVPCPAQVAAPLQLRAAGLPAGAHDLLVRVTDAAGNPTDVHRRLLAGPGGLRLDAREAPAGDVLMTASGGAPLVLSADGAVVRGATRSADAGRRAQALCGGRPTGSAVVGADGLVTVRAAHPCARWALRVGARQGRGVAPGPRVRVAVAGGRLTVKVAGVRQPSVEVLDDTGRFVATDGHKLPAPAVRTLAVRVRIGAATTIATVAGRAADPA